MEGNNLSMNNWWLEKPLRLIQTNLREIDTDFDIEKYISSLKEFSANTIIFNTGGIIANYPTKLQFHYQNPNLINDLVGTVLKRVHQEGIKFIARFDFSKVNEVYLNQYPEWFYVSNEGANINYNGQVHVCLNSAYQQEYSLEILEEVIESYEIDGVFFNMSGYVTYDYSGNYHGICQCESCKKRFAKWSGGLTLPQKENSEDEVYRRYVAFQHETTEQLFQKIAGRVKSKNKNIAICNYGLDSGYFKGTDILRNESNTALSRPLPEWNYSASDNTKKAQGSIENIVVSNSAVHFIDYPYRFSAVSPHLTALRLAQNIANGSGLDYYVIGHLDNQDDRACLPYVIDLFAFHKENERYFTDITSVADVALVIPETCAYFGSLNEYKGLFRMLSQNHILFDVIRDSDLVKLGTDLRRYQLIILPDLRNMSFDEVAIIDDYVHGGGKIAATGLTGTCDENGNNQGHIRLNSSGLREVRIKHQIDQKSGRYLRISDNDKKVMNGFEDLTLMPLLDEFVELESDISDRYLNLVDDVMYGPPEKCYIKGESTVPGITSYEYGEGKYIYLPWFLGKHYEKLGHRSHLLLLNEIVEKLAFVNRTASIAAPQIVELIVQKSRQHDNIIINMINLSGQLGVAFTEHIPISDIKVKIMMSAKPQKITALRSKQELEFTYSEGQAGFTLPRLELLECVLVE